MLEFNSETLIVGWSFGTVAYASGGSREGEARGVPKRDVCGKDIDAVEGWHFQEGNMRGDMGQISYPINSRAY